MQGFTLIEILVVVFIIGMTASLIALSIGGDKGDKLLHDEAQAFVQAVDFVSEYAALNGELVGMFITPKESKDSLNKYWCYSWQRFRDNEWTSMPEDSIAEHCMADALQWELLIEGHGYVYDPDLEIQPPVLVFSPSGEATPAEIALFEQGSAAKPQHIEIDMMGSMHWREQEEADNRDAP